jgi:hypothetical protein
MDGKPAGAVSGLFRCDLYAFGQKIADPLAKSDPVQQIRHGVKFPESDLSSDLLAGQNAFFKAFHGP